MGERPRVERIDTTTLERAATPHPTSIVLGNFDGVHRGHQAVIRKTVPAAKLQGLEPTVLTFDPHPASVIAGITPAQLTSLDRRIELMGDLGIERVYVCTFDRAFAALSAEQFAVNLLARRLGAKLVVVGANFRFGRGREGDLELLRELGAREGFRVVVHEMFRDARGDYSSTRVRIAIAAGEVEEAERILGRPHAVTGTVEHGMKLGRTLGFPTANLGGVVELLPANGVYAVRVDSLADGATGDLLTNVPGVMNIGMRPTIAGNLGLSVEAHLLLPAGHTPPDLYGRRLRVHFVHRLREERRFSGKDALVAQIAADVEAARSILLTGSDSVT